MSKMRRKRTSLPAGSSIRWRLTVATALPVFILLSLAGSLLIQKTRVHYAEVARDRAWTNLAPLAVPCARAMAVHALDRLDGYLSEVVGVRTAGVAMLDARILDFRGDPVASISRRDVDRSTQDARGAAADSLKSDATRPDTFHDGPESDPVVAAWRRAALASDAGTWLEQTIADGSLLLHVSVPTISGLRWGTLFATFDISATQQEAQRAIAWMLGVIAVVIATLMFTLRLALGQMVVQPVAELANAAAAIRDGQHDRRAWVPGEDELGQLASNFNAMADELQSYTQSLEQKVAARTAEVRKKQGQLEQVNQRLEVAVENLERLATIDGLTGVFNRRHFDETIAFEFRRGERNPHPFCVVMVDVDHFKIYNDSNGHQAGDVALQRVASALESSLRGTDMLARYGGEEFVALLLDTPKEAGLRVAESLRAAVENQEFPCGSTQPLGRVTASLGVAAWPDDARGPNEVLECADRSLYAAKRLGRNRVIGFGPEVLVTEKVEAERVALARSVSQSDETSGA